MENSMNPGQGLQLITETLQKTKDNFSENSFGFKLWGWLVATASFLSSFLLWQTSIRMPYLPFPIFAVAGILVTVLHYNKRKKLTSTQTYLNYYLNCMWIVFGFAFFTTVFVSFHHHIQPFPYTLIIAGSGTLISGLVMNFRPLQIGGILLFVAAAVSVFISNEMRPILHGIAIIAGYLIPGYLLSDKK